MQNWEQLLLAGLLAWEALTAGLARRNYARLPVVGGVDERVASDDLPSPISVIIPARNEAHRLPTLLASLAAQSVKPAQIIVVDDQSEDGTGALAEKAASLVIRCPGPPAGWTGKTFACHLGAAAATEPWLLFLDADTALSPQALQASLTFVLAHNLDGLSLLLQQRCITAWERLLLPYAYSRYFAGARPSSPRANGQWILLSAGAYKRSGGHEAVRGSLIEDVALAQQCRRAGLNLLLARGEGLASVRMYDSLGAIWSGFAKNSFRFVAADPGGGAVTAASVTANTALPILAWHAWRRGGSIRMLWVLAGYGVGMGGMLFWQRRFQAGRFGAFFYPASAIVFQTIALHSAVRTLTRRGSRWKGRTYRRNERSTASFAPRQERMRTMAIAPTLRRGYRLDGTRQYTLPFWLWLGLTRSLLDGTRRSIEEDAERVLAAWPRQPVVSGQDHVPKTGALVVIANHYQRRGLWIGFAGGILAREIRRVRPDRSRVHFAVIGDMRVRGHAVPGSGLLLGRVARIWSMVSLPTDPRAVAGRAVALRRLFRLALPPPRGQGEPIVLFPEGSEGSTAGLREALPGTGSLLLRLYRSGVAVVPAAVWESGGTLHAQFGTAWAPDLLSAPDGGARDTWARSGAMHGIAALVPPRLRGVFAAPAPGHDTWGRAGGNRGTVAARVRIGSGCSTMQAGSSRATIARGEE